MLRMVLGSNSQSGLFLCGASMFFFSSVLSSTVQGLSIGIHSSTPCGISSGKQKLNKRIHPSVESHKTEFG